MDSNWNNWDTRPQDGAPVQVLLFDSIYTGIYREDGIDGIVEWQSDGSVMEVEEYINESKWRL